MNNEHTFVFTDGPYPSFECDSNMPCLLYDALKKVVQEFYKEK